ncbi:MAG: DUF5682 family protein [Nostocoides sp.]
MTSPVTPVVRVLGVRHHGPGSARSVVAALDELSPDVVLIEGPADADPLLALAADPDLVPPVALLAYAADAPSVSAFWPLAVFSPEWQAIRWAVDHSVPVRFMDLPASMVLAHRDAAAARRGGSAPGQDDVTVPEADASSEVAADSLRLDPLAVLAEAGGYEDAERWWDDLVESRLDGTSPFEVIAEAMGEIRTAQGVPALPTDEERWEEAREAQMRQVLRAVVKGGAERVAVVCGAWHAPALSWPLPPAAPDARALRGLPKRKVALTWVPWTHGRLSRASGYGAGVTSPGWYAHLFTTTARTVPDWLTRVAAELRRADLPISSAHVIEAVRLAETLAVLRGRPLAGLAEVTDATRSVICAGNELTLDLVTRRLVVGEALGQVPESTPSVPLEADLAATCRRLRLRRDPTPSSKDLDLRNAGDTERSRLLHRLTLLGIGWGTVGLSAVRATGTFRETWDLAWYPELAVDVIEASMWGTTVTDAATAKTCSDALGADLPTLTGLVETSLLAGLTDALPDVLAALDVRAARDHDLSHLMRAIPSLVRAQRYGDVRGTDSTALGDVADALLVRVCAGLPAAVTSLDDEGAGQVRADIEDVDASTSLHGDAGGRDRWLDVLSALVGRADVHGLLRGRITRLLLDAGRITRDGAGDRMARALSVGATAADKAAWVEGFLAGSGLLVVHDRALLSLLDGWVRSLDDAAFLDVAPLLRRTFGQFQRTERRSIGDHVRVLVDGIASATGGDGPGAGVDVARAAGAVDRVAQLLGIRPLRPGSHAEVTS